MHHQVKEHVSSHSNSLSKNFARVAGGGTYEELAEEHKKKNAIYIIESGATLEYNKQTFLLKFSDFSIDNLLYCIVLKFVKIFSENQIFKLWDEIFH